MKPLLTSFVLVLLTSFEVFSQPSAPAPSGTNAVPRGESRRTPNSNDLFYVLGPDSKPMNGIPKGKFSEAKVIPSNVFPGTQHTYWVYVPAQYDPSQPAAVMVFNDGQAMMAEPGDVQGHNVLDNLIFRREIPVMLGVFIRGDTYNEKRDWFHQNVRLMQALTKKGYELNYTWGIGNHGQKQGGAIFPEMMRWLWRDQPVSTDPKDMVERSFRHPKGSGIPAAE